ncbi:MAG TPA: prepilin-type N-terminal cleavage/methylation domain-containing protein [Candidatus Pacearchaeota archaeon]|nr:prepilin-type N-terminal cleavage/methylation domain-containing protein [Candidatus Pacearchaeota archaeon]
MPQNIKSFTLIEILVTIVIIGILASVIMISTSSSIDKTKDSIRRNDLGMISRGLRAYEGEHGSYPALSCKIGTTGCLTDLVPEYISSLPLDPVSGNYGYSSTGSEFMLLAKGSTGPITYTDSNGFDGSIIATARHYGYSSDWNSSTVISTDDATNGALWGYVESFPNSWWGQFYIRPSAGFEIGQYDIYIRIRTNGSGTNPTNTPWRIYNVTTATYPGSGNITELGTVYVTRYVGKLNLNETNISQSQYISFSSGGYTTTYYIDFIEFRKVN